MTGHRGLSDRYPVRTSRDQPGPGRTDTSSWAEAMLLDDLLDGYVEWRESARAVADAYERWSFASGRERALRFAAFTATLDQEQKKAAAYAELVTDVQRWLQPPDSHRGA
jgi:hypothetical protein